MTKGEKKKREKIEAGINVNKLGHQKKIVYFN